MSTGPPPARSPLATWLQDHRRPGELALPNCPQQTRPIRFLDPHHYYHTSQPEDDGNNNDIWADAQDYVEVQETAVVQAHSRTFAKTDGGHKKDARRAQSSTAAPTITVQPTISSGKLKRDVDLLGQYLAKGGSSLATSANGRNRKLAFEKTVKRTPVIPVLETKEEPGTPLVVRDLPMMKWDIMARRKFRGWTRERRVEGEYNHWAPLLWLDEEEDKGIPLRPDDRPRMVNKKYKGRINLEFELVPMYELEGEQEPDFDPDLVPEEEPETGSEEESGPEQAPFSAFVSATEILSQNGGFRGEIKSRGEWEPEPEHQGHWVEPALQGHSAAPAEAQQSAGLRRFLRKLSPIRAVKRLFKN
ncbi:hypothetical protein FRC01_006851 [Tulasnella sp. 417]|nr:hypothetical protein FRC01_006851 [Tulasnella sp. 417]